MKLCRFQKEPPSPRIGLLAHDQTVIDLTAGGVDRMLPLLEGEALGEKLAAFTKQNLPRLSLKEVTLLTPVEQQEVWAAGVTYLRSKTARMEESTYSANAYDRVYDAVRPEVFFKSLPHKVVGPGGDVGIRKDSKWNVPEPELALVVNSRGSIVGYTIGNDMSSRDIEGENLLYLPQAKTYHRSCAVGPWITVGESEAEARGWKISITIERAGTVVYQGETSISQLKRPFTELAEFLCRSQVFASGAVLLTGTGIVPPDNFTLQPQDLTRINISGIGTLENRVIEV